jgi:[protein-PII] uridylyltransferase
LPTQIQFDNDSSDTRTLIEIETEDRLGLLYAISHAFNQLALDISGAKICTERGAAIDSFYICEIDGRKVLAPERHRAIDCKLRQAINSLEGR